MRYFVFVILSYQNACYGCENAENRTCSEFFYYERKFRRQCVNMIDTTWGRNYFLTCEYFGCEFRTVKPLTVYLWIWSLYCISCANSTSSMPVCHFRRTCASDKPDISQDWLLRTVALWLWCGSVSILDYRNSCRFKINHIISTILRRHTWICRHDLQHTTQNAVILWPVMSEKHIYNS